MMSCDAERLGALLDGELDSGEAATLRRAMAGDPALRGQFETLRHHETLVRAALAPALDEPMPPLVIPVRTWAFPLPAWLRSGWRLPVMASLAAAAVAGLVVGFGAGRLSLNGAHKLEVATLNPRYQTQLSQVLESTLSGSALSWREDGNEVTLTPVRTFRNRDGDYCREFESLVTRSGSARHSLGIACRSGPGEWRTKVLFNDA